MRQHQTVPLLRARRALLVLGSLVAITLTGCGRLPTDPTVGSDPTSGSTPAGGKVVASAATSTFSWYQVASQWVNKGEAATVSGGRFKIQFVRGALSQGATITIMERDPSITDGIVGPSGMALSKASTLTIGYAGSSVELAADMLKLYRFNDSTGLWETVAGTNDLAAKTFTAKVSVLGCSRSPD